MEDVSSRVVSDDAIGGQRNRQSVAVARGRNFRAEQTDDVEGRVMVRERKNFGGQRFCRNEKSATATPNSACRGHKKNPH